jgi:hypothetical protein
MTISNKDKRGYQLIALAGAIIVTIVAAKIGLGNKPRAGPDGCVGQPSAETVVVLDHSESITDQTRNEIIARTMAHVRDKAAINERITVFYVTEVSKKSLLPAFSRCKPPQEGNRAYENVQGIAKNYQRDFTVPLEAALKVAPKNGKESPVAQALIDISLSQYLRSERNTLLVYSDMLEHTPKFSVYQCTDPSKVISQFRESRKGAQERPEFSQTRVVLNMVPRVDIAKSTLKCRDTVWTWFFGDNEGRSASLDIDYLPGA